LISDGHPHREADRVFRALGDATRRDILVCALRAARCAKSSPSVSSRCATT